MVALTLLALILLALTRLTLARVVLTLLTLARVVLALLTLTRVILARVILAWIPLPLLLTRGGPPARLRLRRRERLATVKTTSSASAVTRWSAR